MSTTLKFTKSREYDKGYGYLYSYDLQKYSITKNANSDWYIIKDGSFLFSVRTLKVAKNYVLGSIKMGI